VHKASHTIVEQPINQKCQTTFPLSQQNMAIYRRKLQHRNLENPTLNHCNLRKFRRPQAECIILLYYHFRMWQWEQVKSDKILDKLDKWGEKKYYLVERNIKSWRNGCCTTCCTYGHPIPNSICSV